MIRRPPRSTLFPSRRSSDLSPAGGRAASRALRARARRRPPGRLAGVLHAERPLPHHHRRERTPRRSEEHTSELQSLAYLVCRLLLEKKKKIASIPNARPTAL